jgi:hypothetical protein
MFSDPEKTQRVQTLPNDVKIPQQIIYGCGP